MVGTKQEAELHEKLLTQLLAKYKMQIEFVGLDISAAEIVEQKSYKALCEIQRIIQNPAFTANEKCSHIDTLLTLLGTKFDLTEY